LAIKASVNKGLSKNSINKSLSDDLNIVQNVIPIPRPLVNNQNIKDSHWLAGFVNGEGCFFINIFKSTTKIGFTAALVFQITQHSRDENLLKSLIPFLGCGRYSLRSNSDYADYLVTSFSDIYGKIFHFLKLMKF
jgi:LAGLIDADG endonuclease